MASVSDIAKYLLFLNKKEVELAGDEAVSDIDPLKLQKLLYYCQGYSLGMTGRPLFDDKIEAWKYGPVVKSIYGEYQKYKGRWIPLDIVTVNPAVDDWTAYIVQAVMRDKSKYSGIALIHMTHKEPAWEEAWERTDPRDSYPNEVLSEKIMHDFFKKELIEEGSEEEEEMLWNSAGRPLTKDEIKELVLSLE